MRRALIGVIVGIVGIAAALGLSYPAGAKSAKSHHAHCVKVAESKGGHAKRGAKCKKARRTRPHRSDRAKSVGPTTTPPTGASKPAEEYEPANPVEDHEPAGATPPENPFEVAAWKLLGKLPVPEGAVEVPPVPRLGPAPLPGCGILTSVDRFWHVPGEPGAVVAWISAQVRGGPPSPGIFEPIGEGGDPGGVRRWSAEFSWKVTEVTKFGRIAQELLGVDAMVAEGGGTALRGEAIILGPATCPR